MYNFLVWEIGSIKFLLSPGPPFFHEASQTDQLGMKLSMNSPKDGETKTKKIRTQSQVMLRAVMKIKQGRGPRVLIEPGQR